MKTETIHPHKLVWNEIVESIYILEKIKTRIPLDNLVELYNLMNLMIEEIKELDNGHIR